ncbi:unnamed protein product [Colias eurytheme]|nr:unnamed protein product [Colias eurytheme]
MRVVWEIGISKETTTVVDSRIKLTCLKAVVCSAETVFRAAGRAAARAPGSPAAREGRWSARSGLCACARVCAGAVRGRALTPRTCRRTSEPPDNYP